MQLPGAAWVLLVSGLSSAIIAFLSGEWFTGQLWVPIAITAVSALARWIEVQVTTPVRTFGNSQRGRAFRVLFGG